ncbi:RNA-directed DNA polymerase [Desulfitobacterium hafniense]|nr:RNA-directed DNA polymerase [Desulfitobacterium hafniense]EHL04718.1 reverse transcriptase [Desulfitobacterium hafniense DP7]CDX02910.1 Reverse transcriptase [Desulfitobacterium hafniense]
MLKLAERSLDWALLHIEKYGDTDIFPVPFEFEAIRYQWEQSMRSWLRSQDILQWTPRPYRRCLTPKHRYGFRVATQLDPLETIVFTSLVYEIGKDIESARIPKEEKIAFSHRFAAKPDGRMYDSEYSWDLFQDHCGELVESNDYRYVVIADIADFYPRIYFHPLENALSECTRKKNHIKAITSMIKNWNFSVSYGIPVGSAASRLLAELVIDDVDRGLLSEGVKHCRYVDDYRIFCKNEREAHEHLALLANTLFENHGLTLQQHKTRILPIEEFYNHYLQRENSQELNSLSAKFYHILDSLGIENRYEDIDYDDLAADVQAQIDNLNLMGILKEQVLETEAIDIPLVRFVLKRLKQIDSEESVDFVLDNINQLYPVFKEVITYITSLRSLNTADKHEIGKKLIQLLEDSIVSHLEYHRLWVFDTFTKDREWDNEGKFVNLYNSYHDEFSQRKLILALGRAQQHSWFKSRKRTVNQMSPWLKRAFLAAASCLPGDEAEHWYKSLQGSLDPLELTITKWVQANPF